MESEVEDAPGTTSRARFLGGAAGLTGLAFAGGLFAKDATASSGAAHGIKAGGVKRSYVSGRFALSLDGDGSASIGELKAAQGGQIYGEPVSEPSNGQSYQKKHIANVKYSEITLQAGLSMPTPFYQWIADSWSSGAQRKNGAIIAADFDNNVTRRLDFKQAVISETTIPAMDAGSKEPAYLTLKLAPESTLPNKGGGKYAPSPVKEKQKAWLPSNFRLELSKLDASKVSKIDSFTIKQNIAQRSPDVGDVFEPDREVTVSVPAFAVEPGVVDFPNLRVTIPETALQGWSDWYESMVRQGNTSDDYERTGSIKFLTPNLASEMARIDLFGVGIFNLTEERAESSQEAVRKWVAELYVERMKFVIPGLAT